MNNNRRLHHSLRRLISLYEDGCPHESLVVGLDAALRREAGVPVVPEVSPLGSLRFPVDYGE